MSTIKTIHQKLSAGFFGFWVKKWRLAIMLILLIIGLGLTGLTSIPQESAPQINLGMINISTIYVGASPEDVDELITAKIEDVVEDVDGVKKIESTSRTNISNVLVTVDDGMDPKMVMVDIKSEVDKLSLPTDAEDPSVQDITTDSNGLFTLIVYGPRTASDLDFLKDKAKYVEYQLESLSEVASADLQSNDNYDIRVIVDKAKATQLGLQPQSIAQAISSYVSSVPLGSYQIGSQTYDYRFQKSTTSVVDFGTISIPTARGAVPLSTIATVDRHYDEEVSHYYGTDGGRYQYVALTVKKPSDYTSVSRAARVAMDRVHEVMKESQMEGVSYAFADDAAKAIKESNASVLDGGIQTIIFVFLCVWFFVSFKESLIATFSIPLAFLVTFFVLYKLGYTLNFLTNFSLIVTFGIAIDTIIVILEGCTEKMKLGYTPYTAALLSLREYKTSLIAGTATTCAVFLPLFVLPGVMGKYLANIPITIFITLIAALAVSLLINPAVYYLISKNRRTYQDGHEEEFLSEDERLVLLDQRVGKTLAADGHVRGRHAWFAHVSAAYQQFMTRVLGLSSWKKWIIFLSPIALLIGSFLLGVGFTMMPESEAELIRITMTAPGGSHISYFDRVNDRVEQVLATYPEIDQYRYDISGTTATITLDLTDDDARHDMGQRDSFVLQEYLERELSFVAADGISMQLEAEAGGPPGEKEVGIELIATDVSYFGILQQVADDVETFFKSKDEMVSIVNSNAKAAGKFVFSFDKAALQVLNVTPGEVLGAVNVALNGANAGSLFAGYDDHDIKVLYDVYDGEVSPQIIQNLQVQTSQGLITLGDVASYTLDSNIQTIERKNGNILIKVEADTAQGLTANDVNPLIQEFAESYDWPEGISYSMGGENAENAELMAAMGSGFALALFLIFVILLLQFNSARMPLFIFYSVLMGLLGAMIGLWLTGNPMSLAFMIGFFALTGIVVNDAIVLVDRINSNLRRGMPKIDALAEAGGARMIPIVLTTVTTILGLISVAQQDRFFAGLGYTIMFGLFFGSLVTLFVVPVIYDLFVGEKKIGKMRG